MDIVFIGEKERPVYFGFNALAEFGKLENLSLQGIMGAVSDMTTAQAINIIYCGLKTGAEKAKEDFNEEPKTIGFWLDECEDAFDTITIFMDLFAKSFPTQKADKKKVSKQVKK